MSESGDVQVVHPFAVIPEALLYDRTIPADAVRLYGVLLRHGSSPDNCFPSHSRLADLMGRSARSIPAWVKALEDAGWVERVPRWQRHGADGLPREVTSTMPFDDGWFPASNGYRVHQVALSTRGDMNHQRGGVHADDSGGSTPEGAPNESQVNDSHEERELELVVVVDDALPSAPDPFDRFWAAYPRRVGKGQARKAWSKAIKAADADVIVAAAVRFAAARQGEDPKFTPHPATWLNGERWSDETPRRPDAIDDDRSVPSGRVDL